MRVAEFDQAKKDFLYWYEWGKEMIGYRYPGVEFRNKIVEPSAEEEGYFALQLVVGKELAIAERFTPEMVLFAKTRMPDKIRMMEKHMEEMLKRWALDKILAKNSK